jgi:hypothetical protein
MFDEKVLVVFNRTYSFPGINGITVLDDNDIKIKKNKLNVTISYRDQPQRSAGITKVRKCLVC